MEANLGPGKNPGNRSEVIDAARRFTLRRAAADVDSAELRNRGRGLEVVDKAGVFAHYWAVLFTRELRNKRVLAIRIWIKAPCVVALNTARYGSWEWKRGLCALLSSTLHTRAAE